MEKPVLAAFLSFAGTSLTDDEKRLLERFNPLGVTLFNRNLESSAQISRLVQDIKECVGHNRILIAADQEGGRVNRLKCAGFPDYASQRTLGKINDPTLTELHCRLIAADLRQAGINMNFAPVLDIEYEHTTMALKGRCFGSDPHLIADHGKTVVQTYIKNGICPCIKHLPGHGHAQNDPHLGLPVISELLENLTPDFYPFQQLADCPAGMTAHIVLPETDPTNPITLSARGIREIIRERIGFKGLLISDSIDMRALRGSTLEKANAAWQAGCDAVCYCMGNINDNLALCAGGKHLDDKALARTEQIYQIISSEKTIIKLDHLRKEYYNLTRQFNDNDINYDATEVLHQIQKGEK